MQNSKQHKKIIILEHGGGRLANQLWNYMSIFAYAKERGYDILNYSFFDYYQYFTIKPPSFFTKLLSIPWIRNSKITVWLRPYRRYINLIKKNHPDLVVISEEFKPFYLPPTPFKNKDQEKIIKRFEDDDASTLYTQNWMFRNPVGIKKYRSEIIEYFRPNRAIENSVSEFIGDMRKEYVHVVGVHIRQTDYKKFLSGNLYFEQKEIKEILDEYITFCGIERTKIGFILCSDGKIDVAQFQGLAVVQGLGTIAEDLFTLSACDCIIGSDSTFGAFASFYGNIPFIIFERPKVDWEYYKEFMQSGEGQAAVENGYFENKKSKVNFY